MSSKHVPLRTDRRCTRRLSWLQAALIAVAVQYSVLAIACVLDPGERVHVENHTDQTVAVFSDEVRIDLVSPGDSNDYVILGFNGNLTYSVVAMNGDILASRTFTWEEIREEDGVTLIVE